MKPIVVIPTYNERENVEAMAAAVLENLPPEGRLLFLDDNSPDGTGAVIDASFPDGNLDFLVRHCYCTSAVAPTLQTPPNS